MTSLNVVALISGGKDSLYSILHLLANGHNVVALANLYPATIAGITPDDLDSFMYQTIGHKVIPLYEQALGLPLYRQQTAGRAVAQGRIYTPPDMRRSAANDQTQAAYDQTDETEDLIPLLERIMADHAEVNAISSGAILSDYQRTRVESVALRLRLTPLSYLWQYPWIVTRSPTSLLEDMSSVGQESRIIKVSSGGLNESFLWQDVSDPRTIQRLLMSMQRFGNADDGAALGEGGEFETLALHGPAPLWKGKIVVSDSDRQICPGEAGSVALHLSSASVVTAATKPATEVPQPVLVDAHFQAVYDELQSRRWSTVPSVIGQQPTSTERTTKVSSDRMLFLGAFTHIRGDGPEAATREQTLLTLNDIGEHLRGDGIDFSDVIYVTVVLRDMADFAAVNTVFAEAFTTPNPPARAVVACPEILQPGEQIIISMTAYKPHRSPLRQGLHVQSISYWAPANIGPYSQAISVPLFNSLGLTSDPVTTFIAGQIPLVPASMIIDRQPNASPAEQFLHQAVLSLQHAFRIAKAVQVQQWMHAIVFVTAPDDATTRLRSSIARSVWQRAHMVAETTAAQTPADDDDDDSFDVWHQRHGSNRLFVNAVDDNDKADNYSTFATNPPPLMVLRAGSLPRNANIEWLVFGTSSDMVSMELEHYRHLLDVFASRTVP